jgi:hypothetical protein
MTSIPVQSLLGIPNIDIDLVVVEAKLWVNAGGDVRMGVHFADDGNTYSAGMDGFFEAGLSVSGTVVIACAGASFSGVLDQGFDGSFKGDGTWSADATGTLTLTGSAYAGGGICDSDCDGLCDKDTWSGSKVFGVTGHLGSDGKKIDFYVK